MNNTDQNIAIRGMHLQRIKICICREREKTHTQEHTNEQNRWIDRIKRKKMTGAQGKIHCQSI